MWWSSSTRETQRHSVSLHSRLCRCSIVLIVTFIPFRHAALRPAACLDNKDFHVQDLFSQNKDSDVCNWGASYDIRWRFHQLEKFMVRSFFNMSHNFSRTQAGFEVLTNCATASSCRYQPFILYTISIQLNFSTLPALLFYTAAVKLASLSWKTTNWQEDPSVRAFSIVFVLLA